MVAIFAVFLALLTGALTPREAVQRFIQNRSPADACAQLAPSYRAAIAKKYGPCLSGMRVQPKATHIILTHERIQGRKATVEAAYNANGSHFRERYTLAKSGSIWLITGSRTL